MFDTNLPVNVECDRPMPRRDREFKRKERAAEPFQCKKFTEPGKENRIAGDDKTKAMLRFLSIAENGAEFSQKCLFANALLWRKRAKVAGDWQARANRHN